MQRDSHHEGSWQRAKSLRLRTLGRSCGLKREIGKSFIRNLIESETTRMASPKGLFVYPNLTLPSSAAVSSCQLDGGWHHLWAGVWCLESGLPGGVLGGRGGAGDFCPVEGGDEFVGTDVCRLLDQACAVGCPADNLFGAYALLAVLA